MTQVYSRQKSNVTCATYDTSRSKSRIIGFPHYLKYTVQDKKQYNVDNTMSMSPNLTFRCTAVCIKCFSKMRFLYIGHLFAYNFSFPGSQMFCSVILKSFPQSSPVIIGPVLLRRFPTVMPFALRLQRRPSTLQTKLKKKQNASSSWILCGPFLHY